MEDGGKWIFNFFVIFSDFLRFISIYSIYFWVFIFVLIYLYFFYILLSLTLIHLTFCGNNLFGTKETFFHSALSALRKLQHLDLTLQWLNVHSVKRSRNTRVPSAVCGSEYTERATQKGHTNTAVHWGVSRRRFILRSIQTQKKTQKKTQKQLQTTQTQRRKSPPNSPAYTIL